MILGLPRKRFPAGIQFDMSAQDEGDRAIPDKGGDPFRAGEIGAGVVDKKAGRHQKVARKEQSRIPVVKRDLSLVVAGRRDRVDGPLAEIDLRETVRPMREVVIAPNAVNIKSNYLDVGQVCELPIARTMVHDGQGAGECGPQAKGALRIRPRGPDASRSSPVACDSDLQRRRCRSEAPSPTQAGGTGKAPRTWRKDFPEG